VYRFLATGEDTRGKYALMEAIIRRAVVLLRISTAGRKKAFMFSKARSRY
jgi:hypothetical protein